MSRILVVDDEPQSIRFVTEALGDRHEHKVATNGAEAMALIGGGEFDLGIVDLGIPAPDGFDLLRRVQQLDRPFPMLVVSGMDGARAVIDALHLGARDYILKPADRGDLIAAVDRALGFDAGHASGTGFVGSSKSISRVRELLPLLARVRETVLIIGETGTGKELVARALHQMSPRAHGPFVAHNMAATPSELAESVFFGHVRGAFSGATADHAGLFERARGGTLFLDEVNSLPLPLQAKLLRALESECVQRVGSECEIPFDARVIAASSVDPAGIGAEGAFRADLLYRLRQFELHLPPLRERTEDIPDLVGQFLAERTADLSGETRVTAAAMDCLQQHHWPGNCRELRHTIRSAALLSGSGTIGLDHLPLRIRRPAKGAESSVALDLGSVERAHIHQVLGRVGGNQSLAARLLGIDRGTLARKLRDSQYPS